MKGSPRLPAPKPRPTGALLGAGKARVLVIDDERGILDFFKKALTGEGYRVLTARDGPTGLKKIGKAKPDILLLDLKMPKMDGVELLDRIRRIDKKLVIIMITAFGSMQTAREAMRLGAFDYITKPFDLEHVKGLIREGLRSSLKI